jgi:hypothetical protein
LICKYIFFVGGFFVFLFVCFWQNNISIPYHNSNTDDQNIDLTQFQSKTNNKNKKMDKNQFNDLEHQHVVQQDQHQV